VAGKENVGVARMITSAHIVPIANEKISSTLKMKNKKDFEKLVQSGMCPACKINKLEFPITRNALSRFSPFYICNNCGQREAFHGPFWLEQYE
jgi:hypothetical protein